MPQSLEENPTFIIRPVPTLLPEGSEIIRRKSKAERQSLMVEESTELGLPAGGWLPGCLGGSFIELGGAGQGLPPSTWKGTQGRKTSSRLEKKVPGPFHVTSSSPNRGRKRDSVKAEQDQRPGVMSFSITSDVN